MHYLHDCAQQLHHPSDPDQPGPSYFKNPRKCLHFGVCCKAIAHRWEHTDKKRWIAQFDIFITFSRHGLGKKNEQINADNCGAQNKNSFFMWYYLWRVISGLHTTINYNFFYLVIWRLPGALVKLSKKHHICLFHTYLTLPGLSQNLLQWTLPSSLACITEQLKSLCLYDCATYTTLVNYLT